MTRFEDRLLTELLQRHGHRLSDDTVHPRFSLGEGENTSRRSRWSGRNGALAAACAAVVLAAVGATLLGSSTPAYAVQVHPDGSVTVSMEDIAALEPANADLSRAGVRVKVVPMTDDCAEISDDQVYTGLDWQLPVPGDDGSVTVGRVPVGYTVLLAVATYPGGEGGLSFTAPVSGPVPDCLANPASRLVGP